MEIQHSLGNFEYQSPCIVSTLIEEHRLLSFLERQQWNVTNYRSFTVHVRKSSFFKVDCFQILNPNRFFLHTRAIQKSNWSILSRLIVWFLKNWTLIMYFDTEIRKFSENEINRFDIWANKETIISTSLFQILPSKFLIKNKWNIESIFYFR